MNFPRRSTLPMGAIRCRSCSSSAPSSTEMPWRIPPLLVAVIIALSAAAGAHEHATGIAAERMAMMAAMGKAGKAIAVLVKRGGDPAQVLPFAEKMRDLSEHIQHMFPPGSGTGVTDAAPAIWQRWPEFATKAEELRDLTE